MKLLILLITILFCLPPAFATPEKREVIRPTILPILKGSEIGAVKYNWKQILDVIRAAVLLDSDTKKAILHRDIELIVVLERDKDWVVVFYPKGNSRVSVTKDGRGFANSWIPLNPPVITVAKSDLKAAIATEYIALPWPGSIRSRIEVHYDDETDAEKLEREQEESESDK